jgi:hypothetical protein
MASISTSSASAQPPLKWVTSWTGSVQGPYPIGNPSAQPDLRFVFPTPETGARDQSFRLIVRPDLWSRQVRLRFSNALGTRSVTFDGVHVGLQQGAAVLVAGATNQSASPEAPPRWPRECRWSSLRFVRDPRAAASLQVGFTSPRKRPDLHAKALHRLSDGARRQAKARPRTSRNFRSTPPWYFWMRST